MSDDLSGDMLAPSWPNLVGTRGLQCETNLQEILGCESFGVVRFDLGSLLQGQTRIAKPNSAYNSLILLVLEVSNVKPTYRNSWAGILLVWSDLTLGPSFKVERE